MVWHSSRPTKVEDAGKLPGGDSSSSGPGRCKRDGVASQRELGKDRAVALGVTERMSGL